MKKTNYDYIVIETILQNIVWGNAFYGKYLLFDLEDTTGYLEMEYSSYIENYFPSDLDNEIEETATIIHDSMNEECWDYITKNGDINSVDLIEFNKGDLASLDSRELLAAFIIDFFLNTFNLDIRTHLNSLTSEMFNEMFEDLGEPNDYVVKGSYAYLKE